MFKSIKTKILILQLGLILSVVVILGLIAYLIMFHSLKNGCRQNLEYIVMHAGETLSVSIENKARLLEKIGTSEVVGNYFKKRQENVLTGHFSKFMSEFPVLSYVNEHGSEELKLINGKVAALSDISDLIIFKKAIHSPNKTFDSYSAFCPDMGGPCIEFGFFNKSFFDEFMGFILGKVPVPALSENIQKFRVGQSGFVVLLDSEGTILTCPDKNKILKKITVEGRYSERIISEIKSAKSGFDHAEILGVDGYFAYSPVPGQDWSVVAILPYKEFVVKLNTLRNITMLVSFFILIGGVFASLVIAANITRPITKLTTTAGLIARGNLLQKVDIISKDEIGQLGNAFNKMVSDLKKTTVSVDVLQKEQKRFQDVAMNTGDWIWEVDADGLYTYSSPVVEQILGYKPEEMARKYFYDFFHPDMRERLKKEAFEVFNKKVPFENFPNLNVRKDGKEVILETSGGPILDADGKLLGYRGVDRDITERKQAEKMLEDLNRSLSRTVRKLEDSNQELRDFVYISSHDLREPMRRISSFAGLLKASLEGKLTDDDRENLEFMTDGANRMTQMVGELLTYMQIITKEISPKVIDLNRTAQIFKREEFAGLLEDTGGTIEIPEKLPKVKADTVLANRLLHNIISNAIKYRREGIPPRIVIKGQQVTDNMVRIEVEDNGIGIKKEYYKDIFVIFRRLHSRREYEGIGIGLSVCRKIVERHGGEIGVRSIYGQGSTFWFTLPTAEKTEEKQSIVICGSCEV